MTVTFDALNRNRLLDALPVEACRPLLPHLEDVRLAVGQVLHQPDERIEHVYFPLGGLISLLVLMGSGAAVEVAMIGREGLVGTLRRTRSPTSPYRVLVQLPSSALRMRVETFEAAIRDNLPLQALVQRHMLALVHQIARTAACNRFHPMQQRFARWLLLAHDRAEATDLPLTQEVLAARLGIRRATVAVTTARLRRAGVVRARRGWITIADRSGLEALACEDYRLTASEYDRLYQ